MADNATIILCSIDFSAYSHQVIDWATRLASLSGGRLVLFHALMPPRERMMPQASRQAASLSRENALKKMAQLMDGQEVAWRPWIVDGDASAGLSRVADETDARLIIAASHGLSGVKRMVLGSVVERMAREVHHPMLILRSRDPLADSPFPEESVTVGDGCVAAACDLVPGGLPVAGVAHGLASLLGLRLVLVHSVGSPTQVEETRELLSYSGCQEKLLESLRERLFNEIPKNGVGTIPCEAVVLTGDPAEEILDASRWCRALVMVVGVKHRSRLGKWITGSTTETLIREAPCHVLTVPEMTDEKRLF